MFPSSGLFADINCPFSEHGLCERPHCLYRHATELREMFGASYSIADFAAVQSGYPVNGETKDDCLQELERINKEIETVRHEVEQEQRRLSRYKTVQAGSIKTMSNFSVSKLETAGENVDKGYYGLSSSTNSTKAYSQARKYVVDNSKPRTDLEYDPLSNFSAGLCSYSSPDKEPKVKNGQGLKRVRNAIPCDQKKPVACQSWLSQSPSQEPLDDSHEDGILIIDIPPSPDNKRARAQTPVGSIAGKSLQDKVRGLEEVRTAPILLINAEAHKVASPPASTIEENKVYRHCSTKNTQGPFILYENIECENIPVDGSVVKLTGCLKDLRHETQKMTHVSEKEVEKSPKPSSHPAMDQQDQAWNNLVVKKEGNMLQVELPQCELPHSVEKMNLLQPHYLLPKKSVSYKATANSDSPCRQHTEQTLTALQPPLNRISSQLSLTKCVPSVLPHSQKTPSKMPGQIQGKVAPPGRYLGPAEQASGSTQDQDQHNSSALTLANKTKLSSASVEQHLVKQDYEDIITISSSSDDEGELNYSDMDVSDSDPMEECYRIFMEANNEDAGNKEQPDLSVGAMDVEKPEFNVKPQALPGKMRVAHEVKHTEPVAKSRPQPQVLVPLRGSAVSGFASHPSITSKIQQVQQRASMLTASVKGGQAFVSSTCQRKPETQSASFHSNQALENLQPAPVQNAYMNYISLGPAVIEVGNNLHLILPEGTYPLPVTSSSSQVTSVLTPVSQVQMSTGAVRQMYHPPALTPVQRYRTTAPVLIPAPTRKPSLTSASAASHSSPTASATPQAAVHTQVKPAPSKRKMKQQCEAAKDKVPHDVRQRYVNMFTEEFLKTTANVNDAFEKALAEEKTVYNRSVNKLKYLSVAVNALKKLKNQSAVAVKDKNEVNSQRSKGNIPLELKKLKRNADDMTLYESLKDYILTEEKLVESNFPVKHPERPGCVVLFADNKRGSADPLKRICCRCGATYSVNQTGKHTRKEECNYHYGKGVTKKVPGGVETRYSCCEGVMGAPGCQVFQLHVHDSLSLDGFVSTVSRHPSDTSCPGVYSLDCEMCYTIHGLELSRVTVVNSSLQVVYDTFVRPDNEVIDYNTRFSGISEEDVKGNHTSLREVQETLLSFISADTILIGHGLETDLCALKLLHGTVVDTSVVFPHRLGPPHKMTLNNLTAEYLRRIIQESVCGHDTAEDAAACMELMLWKVKEDGKMKK
ncbi:RNA exonuclease 1 homolog isoform X3 [Epinephelus moara]|uniref:RNA exonuclease 1 homolog isoform X3 n=1 Tax=Epinephelus moara TaxID=300413 RepID=UPI00214E39BD|nr:RNA exonuclease 1 homolog isoform X3 [Epinephelus moara]